MKRRKRSTTRRAANLIAALVNLQALIPPARLHPPIAAAPALPALPVTRSELPPRAPRLPRNNHNII